MRRRILLRRVGGAVIAGMTALLGGRLAPSSPDASEALSDEDASDDADADGSIPVSDAPATTTSRAPAPDAPREIQQQTEPSVEDQLYAAHADRCSCPACGGSPPGSP